jgi:hypothetical protein
MRRHGSHYDVSGADSGHGLRRLGVGRARTSGQLRVAWPRSLHARRVHAVMRWRQGMALHDGSTAAEQSLFGSKPFVTWAPCHLSTSGSRASVLPAARDAV